MTTTTNVEARIPADTFANRLILARAQAGHISIREAADLCGIGRGAWTNWEKGARPEGYETLTDLIAEKLGCDRDWLRHGGSLRPVEDRRPRWRRSSSHSTVYARNQPHPVDPRRTTRPPASPTRTSRLYPPIAA